MRQNLGRKILLCITLSAPSVLLAAGAPKPVDPAPTPAPTPNPTPTPTPTPVPVPVPAPSQGFKGHDFVSPAAVNFSFSTPSRFGVTPSCLRSSGYELVILDAGHDDSDASRRSDAKIRGGNGRYVFQWPEVHEGQLNMVSSYLAYEYLVSNPSLTSAQRNELRTMIRFTRLPGEKTFGQYESAAGYGSTSGTITAGIENRRTRINAMMSAHRPYDSATGKFSKTRTINVNNKTILVSVHANSTDFYDEGDHTWVIPPNSQSQPSVMQDILLSFRAAFSLKLGDLLEVDADDSTQERNLKQGAQSSARESNIRIGKHSDNLAVLSTAVNTPHKILLEGFVMNGKIGHLAYIDIKQSTKRKKLEFYRSSSRVANYDVAEVYMAYAQSIVQGLVEKTNCGQ
jgi:hypothetical protein